MLTLIKKKIGKQKVYNDFITRDFDQNMFTGKITNFHKGWGW